MKKFFALATFVMAVCFIGVSVNAMDLEKEIRIGLVSAFNHATTVQIQNRNISIGYQSGDTYIESARIQASSTFQITQTDLYYVKVPQIFESYEEAKLAADSYLASGYQAIPSHVDGRLWTVYLGGYYELGQAQSALTLLGEQAELIDLNQKGVVLMDGPTIMALFHHEVYPLQIGDADGGIVDLGVRKYRGRIEFSRNHSFTIINVTYIDNYLMSVVPSEMPASWHIEALKAQAIAARNYTVTRSKTEVHRMSGYHLCDSTHCQVYLGVAQEFDSSTRAVLETSGKIAYHQGEVIDAVYFSSSGGVTENSENVWVNTIPYLRSVSELNEIGAKEWTRSFSIGEINRLLSNSQANIGIATTVRIGSFAPSGRVNELVIVGTNGNKTLTKEDIRTFFSGSAGGSLESRNFTISNTISHVTHTKLNLLAESLSGEFELRERYAISADSQPVSLANLTQIHVEGSRASANYVVSKTVVSGEVAADDFIFVGRGWGHGVGMSQYGANGMANSGYTYEQILKHYYTGIEIR